MIVIHYPTAFRALDNYIGEYNSTKDTQAERIRAGAILTARELIRIYGIALIKASSLKGFDVRNLPSLQTNNQQLARLVKCSSRSIQRYIKKLINVGIITAKKFRGTNANYELWFRKDILSVCEQPYVNKQVINKNPRTLSEKKMTGKSSNCESKTPGCPHTYSGNLKNNLIITVDKADNSGNSGNISGNTRKIAFKNVFSGAEKSSGAAAPPDDDTRKIASQVDQSNGSVPAVYDPTCDNFQNLYVRLFWMMARNLLYKDVDLVESQVQIAQKLIWNLYAPVKKENIDHVHRIYIERLSLVARYVAKDPTKRFVPLPYIYFNTGNSKGFVGTKRWYKDHQERKKELLLEMTLSRAIGKFARNEKKDPSKRRPQLKVYLECENTLGKLGDPSLLKQFHAAVLEHHGYSKIYYA